MPNTMSRPLEYQSLKAVLHHMDPNVRFDIGLRMPSIRKVEKIVPLKIRHLDMGGSYAEVNDTHYDVGVVRHLPHGTTPWLLRTEWDEYGEFHDIDEYGFRCTTGHNVLLPGDISFKDEAHQSRHDTEEDERGFEERLRVFKKAQRIFKQLRRQGTSLEDHLQSLEPVAEGDEEELALREAVQDAFIFKYRLRNRIARLHLDLMPFKCRRKDKKQPFTCFIQVTINRGEVREVKRYEYNKQLFEATKHLHEVLFGGRRMPIRVGRFEETGGGDGPTYRLPVGFRLQVQEAVLRQFIVVDPKLLSILLNADSLKMLKMETSGFGSDGYESKLVRNARKLLIDEASEEEVETLVEVLRHLTNVEIGILPEELDWPLEYHLSMLQSWSVGNRRIGSSFWMKIGTEQMAMEALRVIKAQARYKKCETTERSITIPQPDSKALEITIDQYDEESWMMKAEVVSVELNSCITS